MTHLEQLATLFVSLWTLSTAFDAFRVIYFWKDRTDITRLKRFFETEIYTVRGNMMTARAEADNWKRLFNELKITADNIDTYRPPLKPEKEEK